ncbi:hypothetical protein ACHAPX_000720 [Trichoderma viride]
MAISPTEFAKKTAQFGRMRNVESFLPTANGSEVYVPRISLSSLCADEERRLFLWRNVAIPQNWNLIERMQAPEIQTMYNVPLPISALRTRMRQEFERNRHASNLSVVDVLLFKSHAEYQETMNFWKQQTHILSYFNDNFRGDKRLPSSFMSGFLEGRN